MSKERIRREIEVQRKTLDFQWLETASAQVVKNFQTLEAFKNAETVALYMAIDGEVQLDSLFSTCWKLGKRTCIPVFNADAGIYEMAEITAETRFKSGQYGIREPVAPELVSSNWIDLMVVPGVAFDRKGNRLGRGGGYYDRLLDGFSGHSAAVAFDFQLFPEIPHTSHDIPVDSIATETIIVEVQNEH